MLVQRVLLPVARRESWTVLGDDGPVQPIERYLAYLTDIERSPNTVKAYAHDLKDWFVFLAGQGLDWREVRLEDVAGFVAWLRRPLAARDGAVAVLPSVGHHCGESTERGVAEQGPDRGQPQVPGSGGVAAAGLQVVEETGDHLVGKVVPAERGGWLAGGGLDVAEQQPQGIPVRLDGPGADPPLADQPVGKTIGTYRKDGAERGAP